MRAIEVLEFNSSGEEVSVPIGAGVVAAQTLSASAPPGTSMPETPHTRMSPSSVP